jgi:hypothetical protein
VRFVVAFLVSKKSLAFKLSDLADATVGQSSCSMGNSPSSFATASHGLTSGDASALSEEVWSDLWGTDSSHPPISPGDMLNSLTDESLRTLRAERPLNLVALVARAVCRLEELIAPDAGTESFGAVVVPKDACLLLTPLRVLTRCVPFAIGTKGTNLDASEKVFDTLLWGDVDEAFACPRPAPTWRRHVALALPPSRAAMPAKLTPTLGERVASLALDLLFLPGFTTRFDPNDALTGERRVWDAPTGREYAPPYDTYADMTAHRAEVTRLWLALVGTEALCSEPRTRSQGRFSGVLAGCRGGTEGCRGVPCSRPVSHRDVHGALTDAIKSQSGSGRSLEGSAAGELLATAHHAWMALLEYDAGGTSTSTPGDAPFTDLTNGRDARTRKTAQARTAPADKGGLMGWLDEMFGGFFIPYDPKLESTANEPPAGSSHDGHHGVLSQDTDATHASSSRNVFAEILGETRSESELEGLHQALLRTLRSATEHPGGYAGDSLMSYVPSVRVHEGVVKVRARSVLEREELARAPSQEAAILAMRLLRSNDGFFEHVTNPKFRAGVPLASALVQIMYAKLEDVNAGGFHQCASFVLLRLSASSAFASALNDVMPPSSAAKLGLSTDGGQTHTHADGLIHAVHALLCECDYTRVAPLVDPLLTTLRNAAPRWRGLGDVGSAKLLKLCQHFAADSVLFLTERARHDLSSAVHVVDGCLAHGAGRNPRLVRALCTSQDGDVFDRIDAVCRGLFRSPRPALSSGQLDSHDPEFIPSGSFVGARPGYFFRLDVRGAGYYIDRGVDAFRVDDDDTGSSDYIGSDYFLGGEDDSSGGDDDDGSDSGVAFRRDRFRPDARWFEAVRADIAPALFAARTLRRELSEALREYELEQVKRSDSSSSGDSTVEHLAGLEVANLLPPPPPVVVRRFAADAPEIVKWLRGYAMGVALVRHNAGAASTACGMLFDASRVRLVRVATSFEDVF